MIGTGPKSDDFLQGIWPTKTRWKRNVETKTQAENITCIIFLRGSVWLLGEDLSIDHSDSVCACLFSSTWHVLGDSQWFCLFLRILSKCGFFETVAATQLLLGWKWLSWFLEMVSNAIPGKTHRKHLAEGWELRSHISRTLQNNETVLRLGTGPDHANFGVKFHKFQPVLQNLGQIYGESNPSPLVSFLKIGHRKCQFSKLETSPHSPFFRNLRLFNARLAHWSRWFGIFSPCHKQSARVKMLKTRDCFPTTWGPWPRAPRIARPLGADSWYTPQCPSKSFLRKNAIQSCGHSWSGWIWHVLGWFLMERQREAILPSKDLWGPVNVPFNQFYSTMGISCTGKSILSNESSDFRPIWRPNDHEIGRPGA